MLYLGMGDLPIYNFDKIQRTGNLAYLVVGWDERKEIEIPDGAEKLWEDIVEQWHIRTSNNEALVRYTLEVEIGYMCMRYEFVRMLIGLVREKNKKDFIEVLNGWGLGLDEDSDLDINNIKLKLKGMKMNIELKQSQLKELKVDDEEESEPITLLAQQIKLERGLGIKIDIYKDSVDKWLAYFDELKEINRQMKKYG